MVPSSERCDDTPGRCRLPSCGGVRRRCRTRPPLDRRGGRADRRTAGLPHAARRGDRRRRPRGEHATRVRRRARHPPVCPGTIARSAPARSGDHARLSGGWRGGSPVRDGFPSDRSDAFGVRATGRRGAPVQPPRGARGHPGARRGSARGQDHGRRVEPAVVGFERTLRSGGTAPQAAHSASEAADAGVAATLPCRPGRGERPISAHEASGTKTPALPRRRSSSAPSSWPCVVRDDHALRRRRSPWHDPVRRPGRADPHGVGTRRASA